MGQLRNIHLRLLQLLENQQEIPSVPTLANTLGVETRTVRAAVKFLIDQKILLGIRAEIDLEAAVYSKARAKNLKLATGVERVFYLVTVTQAARIEEFTEYVKGIKECLGAYALRAEGDYLLHFVAPTMHEIDQIVVDLRKDFSNAIASETGTMGTHRDPVKRLSNYQLEPFLVGKFEPKRKKARNPHRRRSTSKKNPSQGI